MAPSIRLNIDPTSGEAFGGGPSSSAGGPLTVHPAAAQSRLAGDQKLPCDSVLLSAEEHHCRHSMEVVNGEHGPARRW